MPDNSSPRRKALIKAAEAWCAMHNGSFGPLAVQAMADFADEMLGDQEPATTTEPKLTKGGRK